MVLEEGLDDLGPGRGRVAGSRLLVAEFVGAGINNLEIHARCVDLRCGNTDAFLADHGVGLGQSGPVPNPVKGIVGPNGDVSRELDVGLAPQVCALGVLGNLAELILTRSRNLAGVVLVALAVIVVTRGQESSSLVTAGSIRVPDVVDRHESVVGTWLLRAVDVDGSPVPWLVLLCCWERHMTILLVAQSDVVARGGDQLGVLGICVSADGLLRAAEEIGRKHNGTLSPAVGRDLPQVVRNISLESRISASYKSPLIACGVDHSAVGRNAVHLLNPGVSGGRRYT